MELRPGLHRIGNDIVAAYLVVTDEGITIIDAGLPGHWHDLRRELAHLHRPLDDVRGLILTHGDSDHIGFAERLRRELGVPVFVHEADAHRARTGEKPSAPGGAFRVGASLAFLGYGLRKGITATRHVAELTTVRDGDLLPLPGAPRIVGMPGHSPGSIAVHVPTVDAVFVGDALTTRNVLTGLRGPRPAPFTDDPGGADASLDVLAAMDAAWVLPGHGAPWHGTPRALVEAVRAA